MKNIYTNTKATFTTANGETVSYQEIFESIRKSVEVYGHRNGWFMDEQGLEDLLQDTILRAVRYHGSFDPRKANTATWASRIAGNAQKDALKSYVGRVMLPKEQNEDKKDNPYRRRLVPLMSETKDGDEDIASYAVGKAVDGNDPCCVVESSEAMDRIMEAIAGLKENYRFVISLQMKGMKPKKMAELLGCSADNAATLLFRARKALKRALGKSFLAEYGIAA